MPKTMLAGMHRGDGRVSLERVAVPKLKDVLAPKKFDKENKILLRKEDLVLLKVEAASICGTDLHILEGKHGSSPPVTLGHEYVGRVIETGVLVDNVKVGDFVAVDPNIKCWVCYLCRSGRPNMCKNMTTLGIFIDGGFAEYNVAPAKQLYLLPRCLDIVPERAVFFEPLSCVVHGLEKLGSVSGESVLIYGGGPIGCLFTALCVRGGATVVVTVEPSQFRHRFINSVGGLPALIQDLVSSQFSVVIDASGAPAVVPEMIDKARDGARLLLFGQQNIHASVQINPTAMNQKELRIFGSYAAAFSFEKTVALLADPRLRLEPLVSHRVSLKETESAFDLMKMGEALKVVISP